VRASSAGQSALLLLDVVVVLRDRSIDYAVVGAMAGAAHGVVRASVDADALVSIATSEAPGIRDTFAAAGFQVQLRRGDAGDPIGALLEIRDRFENRVDLLIGLRGLDPAVFLRAINVPFGGEVLRVASREDYVAMKLFAGGPQDLLDARHAYELDPQSFDEVLLRQLAGRYGKDANARAREPPGQTSAVIADTRRDGYS
jgi:hypothetical protein